MRGVRLDVPYVLQHVIRTRGNVKDILAEVYKN
jgi:hypothetical protein